MRRVLLVAAVAVIAAGGVWFSNKLAKIQADTQPAGGDAPAVQTPQLPIAQVVLFSSGVGYFQREGVVQDNARIDLSFPVTDINDLLKSMVLRDLDGGHISTVSYESNAPLERTLKSFAVNLTGNPSLASILNQARGEKVEVVTQQGTMSGAIVGIEKQQVAIGKSTVEAEMLNLWCSDGMRSLKLSEIQRLRFLNPILEGEFKKALETLAQAHDTQKKSVSINCIGEGKRQVRVGYVIENPIWKTSYRLVLEKGKPYLQGWAIVENTTDEDWKDVHMALVSGRPISYQMDLYQPLYVPRPVVEPDLFASLRPPTYNGALTGGDGAMQARIRELMQQYNALYKQGKYAEAQALAQKVLELDPDSSMGTAALLLSKRQIAIGNGTKLKEDRADFMLKTLNDAEEAAPDNISKETTVLDGTRQDRINRRGLQSTKSATEREVEKRLNTPVALNFTETPLATIIDDIRRFYGINIWIDEVALAAEGININAPVTVKIEQISLRSALSILLKGTMSTWIAKDGVVQITTESRARSRSVEVAATGSALGSSFRYAIDKPVTLPRQKSAMLPIVSKHIEGTRVSIYNEQVQAQHPLLGVKLKNTSGLHLMQGPITVFDGSNYAGDARILDMEPKEERLISYAVDLGTEVAAAPSPNQGRVVAIKALKGLVKTTTRIREAKKYTIKNRNDVERVVLIEHPVRDDFHLVETAAPAETTRDCYRFQVAIAPGKTATQTVTEERVLEASFNLANTSDEEMRFFMSQKAITPECKAGLQKAIELRTTMAKTRREIAEQERQLKTIVDDQTRLRANLKEMPATAAAYKRYLKKFDDQETQIEDYQAKITKLQGVEHGQKKVFEVYLANFSAE